ncbi:MAG: gluconate 2-dehydrogenase subunit 3 family protein [Thermomicrobiales bacterium]
MTDTDINTTGLTFFSLNEAEMLDAIVGRIVPGDAADPGACEIGVVTYIDRAVAGAYVQCQRPYREGMRALNAHIEAAHGCRFTALSTREQDGILAALEGGSVDGVDAGGGRDFLTMIWAHTIEGMFSDPAYGGNRDAQGWRLIGFPGAHYGYSAEEMRYGNDPTATKPMVTLADIRVLARERPELFFHRAGSKARDSAGRPAPDPSGAAPDPR